MISRECNSSQIYSELEFTADSFGQVDIIVLNVYLFFFKKNMHIRTYNLWLKIQGFKKAQYSNNVVCNSKICCSKFSALFLIQKDYSVEVTER